MVNDKGAVPIEDREAFIKELCNWKMISDNMGKQTKSTPYLIELAHSGFNFSFRMDQEYNSKIWNQVQDSTKYLEERRPKSTGIKMKTKKFKLKGKHRFDRDFENFK